MEAKVDPLRQHILEAVDCLRQRKCRPDRESIAHYVIRKFGSTMNEIYGELENIVDEGGLIKVEYKGTTSYRNPQSFDCSPLLTKHSKILNSTKTTRLILSGINDLLTKDPAFSKAGVPLTALKQKLVEFDGARFADEHMSTVLEREMSCGGIQIAYSDSEQLVDSIRVFPRDIPVPPDMSIVIAFHADNSVKVKEEKKFRKSRTSDGVDFDAGTPLRAGGAEGMEFDIAGEVTIGEELKPTRKNARLTAEGRKIVAEKVAEAVRKSYETTNRFESTSAQMIKLASALVTKPEKNAEPKGPSLVLASTMLNNHRSESGNQGTDNDADNQNHTSLNRSVDGAIKRGRGRPTAKKGSATTTPESKSKDEEDEIGELTDKQTSTDGNSDTNKESPPVNEQGRSKRDKRKKQVFDPSDLPTAYSRAPKKARLSENLLSKKSAPTVPVKRGRKSVPATASTEPSTVSNTPTTPVTGKGKIAQQKPKSEIAVTNPVCDSSEDEKTEKVQKSNTAESSPDAVPHESKEIKVRSESPVKKEVPNIVCSLCGAGHVDDVNLKTDKIQNEAWICNRCKEVGNEKKSLVSSTPTPKRSKVRQNSTPKEKTEKLPSTDQATVQVPVPVPDKNHGSNSDSQLPDDLRLWSMDDIEKYFTFRGLKDEASNLRRQEVDGYSLLLLQREDVVNGMGFRLGPALKVYRVIKELQDKAPIKPHPCWTGGGGNKSE